MSLNKKAIICFVLFFSCLAFDGLAYELKSLPARSVPKPSAILNIVFCPLHYQKKDDFLRDSEAMMQRLSGTKPFDQFAQDLGTYAMSVSAREGEAVFKKVQGFPPLKIRQDFLDSISSQLGASYKLVILDASGRSFCAELSSKDEMSLIILGKAKYGGKDSFAKGFLHELGHSLGLRDESPEVYAKESPAGYPNCATSREEARKWWGDLKGKKEYVDYIRGCCGNKSYFRPTIASLMNDVEKADDFGPVNERYLREILSGEGNGL